MKKVKCPQMKCVFNHVNGCRKCKQCHCEPNVIDEDCDICWNCAHDEGAVRWDDDDKLELNKEEKEKFKERLTKVINKPMVISTPSGDIR